MATPVLYYPARLMGTHASALSALQSVELVKEKALLAIENAKVDQSAVICVDCGNGFAAVVVPVADGVQLWRELIGYATAKKEEALELAKKLREENKDGAAYGIFDWTPMATKARH